MEKFSVGQNVRYNGNNNALKAFIGNTEFIVEQIHDPGSFTNLGGKNISGKNIYRVYNQKERQHFIFTEDELTAVNDDDETLREYNEKEKAYNRARQELHEAALKEIRRLIRSISPTNGIAVNIQVVYDESYLERICKYYTAKDYPGNYCLKVFAIDQTGKFFINADDIDDDSSIMFNEKDFSTDELVEIRDALMEIHRLIQQKYLYLKTDGILRETRFRHIGYYKDFEDLKFLCQKDGEEIVSDMKAGFGHFYRFYKMDDGEEFSLDNLENGKTAGSRKGLNFLTGDGNYFVVNQTNPEEDYNVEQPDSPVFIDIYEKIEE